MASKNKAVFGVFNSVPSAESAVDSLVSAGFSSNDVSVLMQDQQSSKDFAHEKHTKAPEGAATGAATGGILGGTLGLLAGIGLLAIPGVGPLIAAGPIMGSLAGLGVGAATGGIVGGLVGLGIPEFEAKRYEGLVNKGGVLLSVHCDTAEEIKTAEETLKRAGAEDVSTTTEAGTVSTSTVNTTRS